MVLQKTCRSLPPGFRSSGVRKALEVLVRGAVHERFSDPPVISGRIGKVEVDLLDGGFDDRDSPTGAQTADGHPVLVPGFGGTVAFSVSLSSERMRPSGKQAFEWGDCPIPRWSALDLHHRVSVPGQGLKAHSR